MHRARQRLPLRCWPAQRARASSLQPRRNAASAAPQEEERSHSSSLSALPLRPTAPDDGNGRSDRTPDGSPVQWTRSTPAPDTPHDNPIVRYVIRGEDTVRDRPDIDWLRARTQGKGHEDNAERSRNEFKLSSHIARFKIRPYIATDNLLHGKAYGKPVNRSEPSVSPKAKSDTSIEGQNQSSSSSQAVPASKMKTMPTADEPTQEKKKLFRVIYRKVFWIGPESLVFRIRAIHWSYSPSAEHIQWGDNIRKEHEETFNGLSLIFGGFMVLVWKDHVLVAQPSPDKESIAARCIAIMQKFRNRVQDPSVDTRDAQDSNHPMCTTDGEPRDRPIPRVEGVSDEFVFKGRLTKGNIRLLRPVIHEKLLRMLRSIITPSGEGISQGAIGEIAPAIQQIVNDHLDEEERMGRIIEDETPQAAVTDLASHASPHLKFDDSSLGQSINPDVRALISGLFEQYAQKIAEQVKRELEAQAKPRTSMDTQTATVPSQGQPQLEPAGLTTKNVDSVIVPRPLVVSDASESIANREQGFRTHEIKMTRADQDQETSRSSHGEPLPIHKSTLQTGSWGTGPLDPPSQRSLSTDNLQSSEEGPVVWRPHDNVLQEANLEIIADKPTSSDIEDTHVMHVPASSLTEELFPTSRPEVRDVLPTSFALPAPGDDWQSALPLSAADVRPARPPSQKQLVYRELENLGDGLTVLLFADASKHLLEEDFRRLIPKGKHLEDWQNAGGYEHVIPGRNPTSLQREDHYYITFTSPIAAHHYQANVIRMFNIAREHTQTSLASPVAAPPGFLVNGVDVDAVKNAFSICPASGEKPQIRMLTKPYRPQLLQLVMSRGYPQLTQVPHQHKVLWRVEGAPLVAREVRNYVHFEGKLRALAYSLVEADDSIVKVDLPLQRIGAPIADEFDERFDALFGDGDDKAKQQEKPRVHDPKDASNAWIISFTSSDEAKRFVTASHERPFPWKQIGVQRDLKYWERSSRVTAELLW